MKRINLGIAVAIAMAFGAELQARIRNVPDQYDSIQAAIRFAGMGDTVLVEPGTYTENIDFLGKQITVASLLLTTGDRNYIESTIIDGDSADCCVAFNNREGPGALLQGFTLRNGVQMFGGGVDIQTDASPRLLDLLITGNYARQIGAGIYCTWNASPHIERVTVTGNQSQDGAGIGIAHEAHPTIVNSVIQDNVATGLGGGIYAGHGSGELTLDHVLVEGNTGGDVGGIYLEYSRHDTLRNVTIAGNSGDVVGGIALYAIGQFGSQAWLINSIVRDNSMPGIGMVQNLAADSIGNWLEISYSDIEWGRDSVRIDTTCVLDWSEGNIDQDPLWVDPDEGDYGLQFASPCIDAGDPDGAPDPDSSRADMGAYPYLIRGVIEGFVSDIASGAPLPDALVVSSFGNQAVTDSAGFYRISAARAGGDFDLTARRAGYNDSTQVGLHLDGGDTVSADFGLTHPGFAISVDSVAVEVDSAGSGSAGFAITNDGVGDLLWSARVRNAGPDGIDPWQIRKSLGVALRGNTRVNAALFIAGQFQLFFTGDSNYIEIWDRDLENYIATFPGLGGGCVAWDGERYYLALLNYIRIYDSQGILIDSWFSPYDTVLALVWDPTNELLWLLGEDSQIAGLDVNGLVATNFSIPDFDARGLACWRDDPDGQNLYLFGVKPDSSAAILKAIVDGRVSVACDTLPGGSGEPVAASIAENYDRFGGTAFITVSQTDTISWVDVRQLHANTFWLTITPDSGVVTGDSTQQVTLNFATVDTAHGFALNPGVYEGRIDFTNSAPGGSASIPVAMTVREPPDVAVRGREMQPVEFGITSIYPNPFNAAAVVGYRLSVVGKASLRLYDITGRLALTVAEGVQTAGEHRAVIDGSSLASGIYIARLEAGSNASVRKVVCVK